MASDHNPQRQRGSIGPPGFDPTGRPTEKVPPKQSAGEALDEIGNSVVQAQGLAGALKGRWKLFLVVVVLGLAGVVGAQALFTPSGWETLAIADKEIFEDNDLSDGHDDRSYEATARGPDGRTHTYKLVGHQKLTSTLGNTTPSGLYSQLEPGRTYECRTKVLRLGILTIQRRIYECKASPPIGQTPSG